MRQHKNDDIGHDTVLGRAIAKYGWENFSYEIIEESDDKEHLLELEIYYIKHLIQNCRMDIIWQMEEKNSMGSSILSMVRNTLKKQGGYYHIMHPFPKREKNKNLLWSSTQMRLKKFQKKNSFGSYGW